MSLTLQGGGNNYPSPIRESEGVVAALVLLGVFTAIMIIKMLCRNDKPSTNVVPNNSETAAVNMQNQNTNNII
ncbi:MAG: hypothetical protein ACJA02_000697 [Myxococcota bacterium]|jgi:hypothetical protein